MIYFRVKVLFHKMAIESEYEVPTWNQIYEMLQVQAQKIQSSHYKPDVIVGVARGGLAPARILMDLLETRDFAIIQIEYYQGINQPGTQPILKQCLNTDLSGKKVLLVDDVDTMCPPSPCLRMRGRKVTTPFITLPKLTPMT